MKGMSHLMAWADSSSLLVCIFREPSVSFHARSPADPADIFEMDLTFGAAITVTNVLGLALWANSLRSLKRLSVRGFGTLIYP